MSNRDPMSQPRKPYVPGRHPPLTPTVRPPAGLVRRIYAPSRPPQRSLVTARPGSQFARFFQFVAGYVGGLFGGGLGLVGLTALLLTLFPLPRTNVLLLGLDRRPGDTTFVSRADTLILTTVYAEKNYVGLLSIPRDLWVTLPDGSANRINTAHFFAEADAPGTGPAASQQTVQSNFGVDTPHYVRIDFAGFVGIVEAVGGLDVDVPTPLFDDEYPTYDYGFTTVSFEAGPQHLNGEQALAYARIRHGSSDFQRAERQQLVIAAFIHRLSQPQAWPRFPALVSAIGASVDTDLSLLDMLRLAPTLVRVGPTGLDRRIIEGAMVQPYTTAGGAAVQLPVWEAINPVLLEMFGQ